MTTHSTELVYLASAELEMDPTARDLRGLVVVEPDGLRVGEVVDVVIDVHERRPRLLVVVSGGVLGLATGEILVPIEAVTEVDDRMQITWSHAFARVDSLRHPISPPPIPGERSNEAHLRFTEAYDAFGVLPFWLAGRPAS